MKKRIKIIVEVDIKYGNQEEKEEMIIEAKENVLYTYTRDAVPYSAKLYKPRKVKPQIVYIDSNCPAK